MILVTEYPGTPKPFTGIQIQGFATPWAIELWADDALVSEFDEVITVSGGEMTFDATADMTSWTNRYVIVYTINSHDDDVYKMTLKSVHQTVTSGVEVHENQQYPVVLASMEGQSI